MKPRKIAICALTSALLCAVQFALSFVYGIELVTVTLISFSYVFGARCGVLTAAVFSVLRCLIFGFFPNVLILYLIYYPSLALLFAMLKKSRPPEVICPLILGAMLLGSVYFLIRGLPVSALYRTRVTVLFAVLAAICAALLLLYCFSKNRELVLVTAAAAVMTVSFTVLDDMITPLMMGYSREAAAGYFYGSFLAMLPQTICVSVSVFVLFTPLTRAFGEAYRAHG